MARNSRRHIKRPVQPQYLANGSAAALGRKVVQRRQQAARGRATEAMRGIRRHGRKWRVDIWDPNEKKNVHVGLYHFLGEAQDAYQEALEELVTR